jgi:hypothetical protein
MSGWNGIFYNGVWTCGFDFLPSGTSQPTPGGVFDSVSNLTQVGSTFARFSGKGMQCYNNAQSYVGRSFGVNLPSVVVGFAFLPVNLPSSGVQVVATLWDSVAGATQISLGYNSSGQLGFYSAGSVLSGSAPTLLPGSSLSAAATVIANSYCYIELVITIGASGVAQCWVNGNEVINFGGNTQQTANAWVNRLYLGISQGSPYVQFDDIYMLDTTGAAPLNARLGPVRIQTDGPNADSATSGLNAWSYTTPQGTDYANAANIPANAAQYNYDANVGDRMSFKFPSLSTAKVWFLNTWFSAEEDAAGTRGIVAIFRNNAIDQVGPTPVSLATNFTYYNQPSTIDPNTGSLWEQGTVAAAAGCEIGLKVSS